jgi:hypothetical protein
VRANRKRVLAGLSRLYLEGSRKRPNNCCGTSDARPNYALQKILYGD